MIPTEQNHSMVPLKHLRECPFNPRKRYDEEALRELAASLSEHGCLQPLVVRPVPATARWTGTEWAGLKHFEVIAGHRRLRAARWAKLSTLPVVVRQMSDAEAKAVMLTENLSRADLAPSEEATAFAELAALHGLEGAAERVGKPVGYVRDRAALASLPAWFLAAVDRGDVPAGTAAVVAKVPGTDSREKAAACVALGWSNPTLLADHWRKLVEDRDGSDGGSGRVLEFADVLSYRDTKELIRTHFSRQLKGAPFSRKALDLVSGAGSCDACPKRAGNDRELLADGVRGDTCTDPECYAAKVAVHDQRELEKGYKKGAERLPEDFTWTAGESPPRGWCRAGVVPAATELAEEFRGHRRQTETLFDLCGCDTELEQGPPFYAAVDPTHKLQLLIRTSDARKALVASGVLKKRDKPTEPEKRETAPPKGKPAAKASDWETKRQVNEEAAKLAARTLSEYGAANFEDLDPLAACGGPDTNAAYEALLLVARTVAVDWCAMGSERESAVLDRLGIEAGVTGDKRWAAVAAKLTAMAPRQLLGFLLGACGAAAVGETYSGFETLTDDLLAFAELDLDALKDQTARIVAGESSADAKVDAAFAAQAEDEEPALLPRTCRGCGCTDADCSQCVEKTGEPCSWVEADLCSACVPAVSPPAKKKPGTVGALTAPPPSAPVVCAPVGASKLKDVPGLTAQDAACLAAVGLNTLADLERACDAVRAAHSNKDHYAPGVGSQLYEVLRKYPGAFTPGDVTRIGDAVVDHLTAARPVRTSAPAGKVAPKKPKKQPA